MELRVLRYYLTVVREGNMSRAAEALHLTQPTLSRQIAALEKELGTSLFTRGRRLELTDDGLRLARRAEELLALADKMRAEFRDGTELAGTISIGSGDLSSTRMLPAAMDSFRHQHPGVRFELYTNSAEYVRERLDAGLLDFAIMMEPADISRYAYIRLGARERWGLLTRSDGEPASRDPITPQDLVGRPLVASGRPELVREITSWLGMPIERLDIACTANLLPTALALVESGTAAALTIEGAVTHLDPRRFTFRPLSPALTMSSVLAWKQGGPGAPAPAAFLDLLRLMQSGHGGLQNMGIGCAAAGDPELAVQREPSGTARLRTVARRAAGPPARARGAGTTGGQDDPNRRKATVMADEIDTGPFPLGEENAAYAQYFIGTSYLAPLSTEQVHISNVTFEPGCRNNWHIHHADTGGGQILLVTAGRGYYQEWGAEPVELHPGDVVNVPAGVKHWHGAAPDSWFTHIAIAVPGEGLDNEWLEPVADEDYGRLG